MKYPILIIALIMVAIPLVINAQCGGCNKQSTESCAVPNATMASITTTSAVKLSGYNKPNMLDANHYFTYSFAKKPKMGMATLIVKVYDKDKKIAKGFDVYANSDMPSMKGAHSTGDVKLKPNKKGELLVPINFVMPGEWQVDLKFVKGGKNVLEGYFTLKI